MSSTSALYQSTLSDTGATRWEQVEQSNQSRRRPTQDVSPSTPAHRGYLTAAFSHQIGSRSASPALNAHTPAESVSAPSIHYQSSEYSESDDPFFGVNFDSVEGASPSFLSDDIRPPESTELFADPLAIRVAPTAAQHVQQAPAYLPLSPGESPSLQDASPDAENKDDEATRSVFPDFARASDAAPQKPPITTQESSHALGSNQPGFHLTPKTCDSGQSSEDGVAPAAAAMHCQSLRVTVSHWDEDENGVSHTLNTGQPPGRDNLSFSVARDRTGRWVPDQSTGQGGVAPHVRTDAEVESINQLAAEREASERNLGVDDWLEKSAVLSQVGPDAHEQPAETPDDGDDNIPQREIPLGSQTENKPVPGQTYFMETEGGLTQDDLTLMRQGRNWDNAPLVFSISQPGSPAYQPPTSQAAMEKFQRMCRDNDSIVSRAATWGTRRASLPSVLDHEVEATGNILKKLSLSRRDGRRSSILEGLRGLVRRPSVGFGKRPRPEHDDAGSSVTESSSTERKETQAKLAPPSPKPGMGRKKSVPSIDTTFLDVRGRVATIGTSRGRANSASTSPMASPKSPGGRTLSVRTPLNRLRSKSETSGIVDLWMKAGGPPVSNLGGAKVNVPEPDDDEDDEEDGFDDGDIKSEPSKAIDDITPNFAGFRQHVLKLNPYLSTTNTYLVDRIAHQQCVRYKQLLSARVKHLQAVGAGSCSSGSMCVVLGGSPNHLDAKGERRVMDPPSDRFDPSDGDITPLEGAINQENFPENIPMPPTNTLPAEFECQLCFTAKKFQKPSDWTKHVHEDVQPFTCTWERCKEPKIFKRKADWVRHENEGHRHLEWWTCDVDDCHHVCYRRDNFLQHLVREHKFAEPKVKTKAAIKRAGGVDPTWAKVEQCHRETSALPQDEPCRFCGRTFPTWKKLTVHLAKHMEQISLPILRLVAKKELDEDTIISPVQDPPPPPFPTTLPTTADQPHHSFGPSPALPQGRLLPGQPGAITYARASTQQTAHLMLPITPPPPPLPTNYPAAGLYSNAAFDDFPPTSSSSSAHHGGIAPPPDMAMQPVSTGQNQSFLNLNSQAAAAAAAAAAGFPNLPVTSAPYMTVPQTQTQVQQTQAETQTQVQAGGYMAGPDVEPFPQLGIDALGLHGAVAGGAMLSPFGAGGSGGGPTGADGGAVMDPHGADQFAPQGSVSPYSRSPHQPQSGFYHG